MKTYTGGCHCGAVRYQVDLDLKEVISCNCSICAKNGALLAFSTTENFKLLSGESNLTDYQFGKKNIHHTFCSTCGIKSFGSGQGPDGKKMHAINVRCLDDIDAEAYPVRKFDGKSL